MRSVRRTAASASVKRTAIGVPNRKADTAWGDANPNNYSTYPHAQGPPPAPAAAAPAEAPIEDAPAGGAIDWNRPLNGNEWTTSFGGPLPAAAAATGFIVAQAKATIGQAAEKLRADRAHIAALEAREGELRAAAARAQENLERDLQDRSATDREVADLKTRQREWEAREGELQGLDEDIAQLRMAMNG